ncbi:MAG: putative DNA binding domain-containing protein [Clostridiales bacterium]|nr:putative DNA binding domain-containing protein [Clostridiales bacterium]
MKVGKENEILEFKKTTEELSEGVISMAAILNKHGGGELYFGVRNDGTPLGMEISDKTLRDVSQAIANHLEPKIYPEINEVYFDGKSCIHVEFSGDKAPYLAFGKPFIRVADEDRQMSSAELEKFILKKSAGRDSWDSEPSSKTVNDVAEDTLRGYLEQANRVGRIDFSYTGRKETLDKLAVTDGEAITNAACALLIGFPLLEAQMAVFATKNKVTFLDIRRGKGNVRELIDTAVGYIAEKMSWRVVIDGSPQRKEIPEVPVDAIREAITNSYCHRDFRSTQNNEVALYSDRIEIYNPGRFPEGMTPEDFIRGKGRSIKRNPNLAQLLYYSKDIESFGTGLQRIAEACAAANVRVEFENDKMGFTVIFYRPQNHMNGVDKDVKEAKNVSLNETERQLLTLISHNPSITWDEAAMSVAKSIRTVQRYFVSLTTRNIIRRVGSIENGHWEIVQPDGQEPRP